MTKSIMSRLAEDTLKRDATPAVLLASTFTLLSVVRAAIVDGRIGVLDRIDAALDLITWGFDHLGNEILDPGFTDGAKSYRELAAFLAKRDLAAIDRQLALFNPLRGGGS
jgi:hypothetical protein